MYALQLAISYVNLAIPTAAARIAVNVRFFQRQGVPPGAAVATGALDGVSGFIVQAILLSTLLLFSAGCRSTSTSRTRRRGAAARSC